MANKTIGQLNAAASVNDTDFFEIEQDGFSKKATRAQITGGVYADMTVSVPSQYASVYDAVAAFQGKSIAEGVTITVDVAAGNHAHTSAVDFSTLGVDLSHFKVQGNGITSFLGSLTNAALSTYSDPVYGNVPLLSFDEAVQGFFSLGDYVLVHDANGNDELTGVAVVHAISASSCTLKFFNKAWTNTAPAALYFTAVKTVLAFDACAGWLMSGTAFQSIQNVVFEGSNNSLSSLDTANFGVKFDNGSTFSDYDSTEYRFGIIGFSKGLNANRKSLFSGRVAIAGCWDGVWGEGNSELFADFASSGNNHHGVITYNSKSDLAGNYSGNGAMGSLAYNSGTVNINATAKNNPVADIQSGINSSHYAVGSNYDVISPASGVVGNNNSINLG